MLDENERCPCNSGKKFKDCHGKNPFVPKEKFTIEVDPKKQPTVPPTIVTIDGKNVDVSDKLRIVLKGSMDKEKDQNIANLVKSFTDFIPTKRNILKLRFERLEHKLNGIKYHMENFKQYENFMHENYLSNEYVAKMSGMFLDIKEPKLMYEAEAFLFQVKSCLDIFAQIIGMIYNLPIVNTYENNGETLINSLKNNSHESLRDHASMLVKIIEDHKKWVKDLVEMRNDITHFSELVGFTCFIESAWEGGNTTDVYYPSMLDGSRATTYMNNVWNELLKLIENSRQYLIDTISKS